MTTDLQHFQFLTKYARFDYDLGRRERWPETVQRTVSYLKSLAGIHLSDDMYDAIYHGILDQHVMPSMRMLSMAGPAAERQNLSTFNCTGKGIDSLYSFVEALIISMAGAGFGFSVEDQFIRSIAPVQPQKDTEPLYFIVPDTTEGWATALGEGLFRWHNGYDVLFDYSKLRPEGSPLYVRGGRASGPEPLRQLLHAVRTIVLSRQGQKLRASDLHRTACLVGSAAVSGGVRRTSMLSLFDLHDHGMLRIKHGNLAGQEYLWNANNSAVWSDDTTHSEFQFHIDSLFEGRKGEPGIFNRSAVNRFSPDRRERGVFVTNPCAEAVLEGTNGGLCNLSSVVVRPNDTIETLRRKVYLATVIGTIQATQEHFPGLRGSWVDQHRQDRLLGVDLNGQMDNALVRRPEVQQELKELAIETNKVFAKRLGINQSAAVTLTKPSGNSATLLDCSSGVHPRWSEYYVRRARINRTDPIFYVLAEAGWPVVPDNGEPEDDARNWVVPFPVQAPPGAITRDHLSAIDHCNYWLSVRRNWAEHTVSVTVNYKPEEETDVRQWLWDHKDEVSGMSFLPWDGGEYDLAPYEAITAEQYHAMVEELPPIDWSRLSHYETTDHTTSSSEIACGPSQCDL